MNSPLHILLVEDHASTNATLTRLLSRDYAVHSAQTAAEALAMARKERVDLVLADIGLPDKDGWSLLKDIRAVQPEVHAIALTGFDYTDNPHRFSEVGFDMHISKPADLPKITSAIKALFPDRA